MKTTSKLMMYGKVEETLDRKPQRGVWVWDSRIQKLVPKSEYVPPRPDAPHVLSDEMDPIVTFADDSGQVFTSRSKYYRHLKEKGMVIKEKGMFPDAKPWKPDPKEIRDTVERAAMDIKYDKVYFSEQEKERWKREQNHR